MTATSEIAPTRVLVATADVMQRTGLIRAMHCLGHRTVAAVTEPDDAATVTVREQPDAALVGWTTDPEHGLALLRRVAESRTCAVVAVLPPHDEALVARAAACGAHAVARDGDALTGALAIALHRHADYRDLRSAFDRRAVTERAKGMLMERHGIDERKAFSMLRSQARSRGRRLEDMASAVLDSQALLSGPARAEPVPWR
jgi:response regulator NasT